MAESSSTEKTTKKKFVEFMGVLARNEDLKTLDPNDLIPHLFLEGVISDEDYERTKRYKIKATRKIVRIYNNICTVPARTNLANIAIAGLCASDARNPATRVSAIFSLTFSFSHF